MDSAIEKDFTQLWDGTSSRLSILLKNGNLAWSFVDKLEEVSTNILWKSV